MSGYQYEICLHFLKAEEDASWRPDSRRLEIYADGARKEKLICHNYETPTWDLSDISYRFHRKILIQLVKDDGSRLGRVVASFSVPSGSTSSGGAQLYDTAGYTLNYTVRLIQDTQQTISRR